MIIILSPAYWPAIWYTIRGGTFLFLQVGHFYSAVYKFGPNVVFAMQICYYVNQVNMVDGKFWAKMVLACVSISTGSAM
jgi:hypothetical protein